MQKKHTFLGCLVDRQSKSVLERIGQSMFIYLILAATTEQDPGFLEKLYTYIVNNIQISIGRVHLRYEDTVTNPDHPFACGVMLKHISAYTTDSKWQPAQMDNTATIIHKVINSLVQRVFIMFKIEVAFFIITW